MISDEHKKLDLHETAEEFKRDADKARARGDIIGARKLMAAYHALSAAGFLQTAIAAAACAEDELEPKCDGCGQPLDDGEHEHDEAGSGHRH